ncbi:hypothetical protein CsSME_00038900 [Camellia sinensis var. sinensis]
MALCKAWCHISEDPIVGNSQSYTHFWGRIYENYCSLQNDQSRTQVSIQSRWGTIMKCSNKFRGCLAQVENLHPSGMSQVDLMLQAKLLYHQDEKKHFAFEHCWSILQNNIRWQDVTPTNTVKSRIHTPFSPDLAPDSPMDNCISLEDDTSPSVGNNPTVGEGSVSARGKRPMGRKSAKELFRKNQVVQAEVQNMSTQLDTFNQYLAEKEKKKEEREEKRIQAMQEMKELEMKKHDFEIRRQEHEMKKHDFEIRRQEHEMRKEEHQIMTADISHLDPQMKAYYTMRKNEIFAKWSSNVSSPNFYFPLPPDE